MCPVGSTGPCGGVSGGSSLLLVGLLVAGAVVAVLNTKPDLEDARDRVDARWLVVRPSLVDRYGKLAAVELALAATGGPDRAVTKDLKDALDRWNRLAKAGRTEVDPGEEAATANELEGLARRVRANVEASPKLKGDATLAAALAEFDTAVPRPPNRGRRLQQVRARVPGRPARVRPPRGRRRPRFGSRPQLVLGT